MVQNEKFERLHDLLDEANQLTEQVQNEIDQDREQVRDLVTDQWDPGNIDPAHLDAFLEKPYILLPKSENEAWAVSPRFTDFKIGWLHTQDEAWNVFILNKYVDWVVGLPDDIKDKVGIHPKYDKAQVDGDRIEFATEDERDRAWNDIGGRDGGLHARKGDREIKIQRGKEFDVIAQLIEDGNLPFTPNPVDDDHLRSEPNSIELRPYQTRAWETFTETGMVGIYWSPGAGKTFISLYAGDRIKGKKLVVVPSNTLKEQWRQRIEKFCRDPSEWEVQTYQYITQYHMDDYQKADIALTIFDENHHLPANSFSKLATINTTYRMGLSASPYREDGRTDYIFALTGYPVGLKWQELIELGVVEAPDVKVYLYSTQNRKQKDVAELVKNRAGRILVFCDSIKKGKRLSSMLDAPFVHGQTTNRMEYFNGHRVVIGSRVADEGLSLDDLDVVVEYDFHGGSRRQEAQRVGRLMHSDAKGEYILMMTEDEYEKHSKRLYSLEEQGFKIRKEWRR